MTDGQLYPYVKTIKMERNLLMFCHEINISVNRGRTDILFSGPEVGSCSSLNDYSTVHCT